MRVERFTEPARFCELIEPMLSEREAENNLMLGLAGTFRHEPPIADHFYAVVLDGTGLILASMMTPPNALILSQGTEGAIKALAEHLIEQRIDVPGVAGPLATAKRASDLLAGLLKKTPQLHAAMRIFENDRVIFPRPVSGNPRIADEVDAQLVLDWLADFGVECNLRVPLAKERVLMRLKQGMYQLWTDPGPVSIAGATGPTTRGIRIGAVYTPPQFRGQGYASNCVATLTQRQLDQGRNFCFLYTDLANPTSNKIYQQIGYRPVCDWMDYTLH